MTQDDSRRVISAVTLAGTAVITLVMAVWGFNALTAPVEDDAGTVSSSTDEPTCAPGTETRTEFVRRRDVTVSVYNAGKRAGRAGTTMNELEDAGFAAGAIGNSEDAVAKVEVRAAKADDPAARLVALAFGRNVPVTVSTHDLGPGVDVIIGDKFRRLARGAPSRLRLERPEVTCGQ